MCRVTACTAHGVYSLSHYDWALSLARRSHGHAAQARQRPDQLFIIINNELLYEDNHNY
jgi:hypothetical protein